MSGLTQKVSVEGRKSCWMPLTSGVPQSRLGPILSSIFVCDTDDGADCVLCKFTDDTELGGVAAIQRDRLGRWADSK